MISTKKRKRVLPRGSLRDDSSQSRSQFKPSHSRSSSMMHSLPQQHQGSNNHSNNLIPTKNSSGDTSSSESEDEFYTSRPRLLRNHSDYETGESSDRILRSRAAGLSLQTQQSCNPTLQQHLDSDSSSDDSVLRPLVVKNLKRPRPLSPTTTSDSSDSGVPIASRRNVKRMRVCSSSEGSSSESSSVGSNDQTLKPHVNHDSTENSNAPGSHFVRNSIQERVEISGAIPGSSVYNLRSRRMPSEESGNESDLVLTNRIVRGRRIPVIESEDDTGFPEEHVVRRRSRVSSFQRARLDRWRGRRNVPSFQQSEGNVWRVTTQTENNVISLSNSRRVIGRRIPVVISEDDSESDTANNNNEISIADRGNETVNSIGSNVLDRGRRRMLSDDERNTVNVLNNDSARIHQPTDQSEDESNSSDSDIRPRTLSNRILPVFQSDDSSSSSSFSTDSDDSIPIRNLRCRNRPIPIVEEDEDIAVPKVQNENSSDTDGESEKCPICLVGFKLQEIGKPKTCDHKFCSPCIKEWATKSNTCPVDRKVFDAIIVYDQIEGKIIHDLPVETTNLQNNHEVDFGSIDDIVAQLFTDSGEESSWFFDSDGDGPDELCSVCGSSNQSHRMISCDFCSSVCHLGCLNPPLRDFPSFGWLCSQCELEESDISDW